jgi:cell division inhibitor SepF
MHIVGGGQFMSITDKFLNFMKLNDDDDYDDDYDEYEEEAPKRFKTSRKFVDDEVDDYSSRNSVKSASKQKQVKPKVVPMRSKNGMEVCVIKPATIEDGREITNTLVSGRSVILNLEGIHVELAQRIIDFTSGSCFAIDGNMQKISNYIFIATPPSVEISGDFQEILNGNANMSEL